MNSKFEKLLASILAVAVLFSCIMITGIASSEDEDVVSVEDMFAASLGAEVGETYIDTDYSASGATVDGWSVGAIGTGNLLKKIGLKLRNRNGAKISEYDAPNSNFVAKLTVYRTDDLYGIQVGTYSNTAAKATYARIVDADYAAGNKLRFYPNANPTPNYTVTLSDSYDLDDKNKAITLYLFSYNGTVYFVDCDGVKLFEYVGAADKIYLNASYCELILTEFSVKALTTLTGVSITYNANGGAFSGGSEKVAIKENIGEKLTAEIPYRENHRFLGWSTSENGDILTNATATAVLNGTTLYAVWQAAHPADGNYTTGSVIDVDFSDWVVASNNNSYNGKDADDKTVDFFSDKLTENGDGEGDVYIRMDTTQITSTVPGLGYYPNFALTMTDNGKTDNTLILDNDTTYKLTLRVRINELNGATAELRVFYSYLKSCQSGNGRANNMSKLVTGIGETNGEWVDIVSYFTTPKEYTDNDKTNGNICDKIYIALGPTTSALVQYDITNVKIEYASKASMYYELSGETILYDTLYGMPGETLDLPESIAEEFYSDEDATGGIKTYNFNKWSYGSDYNEEFIPKFGNVDTVFYCKDISEHYSSTENQDGFCGFDVYGEQLTDYSYDVNAASISAEKAYTGDKSMLVSSDTAFEIRNDNAINIYKGKTYRVSFFFTSEEPLKVGVGVGKANSVASSAKATESVSLAASKEWKKSTVFLTVPYGTTDGYALALIADISSVANFDNITVSSAANAVGAEKEDGDLRFMFTYDTDVNSDNTVIIDGESYTVAERGILVKDPTNSAELVKDNYGKNGVVGTVRTEMDNCFTYNSVTGSVVFSAIIEGVGETDKLSARGYVVLS
ncbi:MAG: InlB B-repeat-containing protein, partial [Clostridia bacterium]|nr:InlB B-repeat-containing protein [Clostridia bacterium]